MRSLALSLIALVLLLSCARASDPQTYTVSGNFPRDLYGPVDTRDLRPTACAGGPCVWGHGDFDIFNMKFNPPDGYRVRVLRFRGDLVSWIKSMPGDPPTPPESTAGVLASASTSRSSTDASTMDTSRHCSYCSDACGFYIQDSVTAAIPKSRAAFNYDMDMLLEPDHVLALKLAAWLNTTGKPIHLELTYTITFRYEVIAKEAIRAQSR